MFLFSAKLDTNNVRLSFYNAKTCIPLEFGNKINVKTLLNFRA